MDAAQQQRRAPRTYRCIDVQPIAGALGAEIAGVDLSALNAEDDAETIAEIRQAWLDNLVVFFRDQQLTTEQFVEFAHHIGEPDRYPFVPGIDEHPDVIAVLKLPHERVNFGGVWHSDTTYLDRPPMATMLLAREIPPTGGDTLFANMYAAFEALSPAMQAILRTVRGVNSSALADVSKTREDRVRDAAGDATPSRTFEAIHPVVRTHPETGREALYINGAHTARFDGMTDEESRGLLQFLFQHQAKPEFTCRFRWQVGSLALWDNRCTHHNPINDYHGYKRLLHRITLKGDVPRHG